jgi:hypothetical protein
VKKSLRSAWSEPPKLIGLLASTAPSSSLGQFEKKTGRPSPPEASDPLEVEEVELIDIIIHALP